MKETDQIYGLYTEAVSKSKNIKWYSHKIGWFHWGVDKSLDDFEFTPEIINNIKEISSESIDHLSKLGVSKQHNYIIIKDLDNYKTGNTAGYADNKTIVIDQKYVKEKIEYSTEIIIHEWAHRYFFNLSKTEKENFKKTYDTFVDPLLDDDSKMNIVINKLDDDLTSGEDKRNVSYIDYILNDYEITQTLKEEIYNYYDEFNKETTLAIDINRLSQSGMDTNDIINQLLYNLKFEYNRKTSELTKSFNSFGVFDKKTKQPVDLMDYDATKELDLDMVDGDKNDYVDMYSHINEDVIDNIVYFYDLIDKFLKKYGIQLTDIDNTFLDDLMWKLDIEDIFDIFKTTPYNRIINKNTIYDKQKYFKEVSSHPIIKIISLLLGDFKQVDNNGNLSGGHYSTVRIHRYINNELPSDYAATDYHELWAESVTNFFKLKNKNLKKVIMNILSYSSR